MIDELLLVVLGIVLLITFVPFLFGLGVALFYSMSGLSFFATVLAPVLCVWLCLGLYYMLD